ncbi:MAG: Lrp/AsnC ligand binding domain-containing protein [Halobacteriota archaeon]
MMHAAYMLLLTEKGKAFSVAEKASKVKNVKAAHPVTGIYDVIVYIEAEKELSESLKEIVENIHSIDGVEDTVTCIAVH